MPASRGTQRRFARPADIIIRGGSNHEPEWLDTVFGIAVTPFMADLPMPPRAAAVTEFYTFTVVGQTGQAGLTGIMDNPSINDAGTVAFTAQLATGQAIFVGDGSSAPVNITPGFQSATRRFSRAVQINNANQVVAQDSVSGSTFVRIWDANNPGAFTSRARGGSGIFDDYDSVFSHPSISNNDNVVFSALSGASTLLATPALIGFNELFAGTPLRPMIADDGRVVVRAGTSGVSQPTDPIPAFRRLGDRDCHRKHRDGIHSAGAESRH